MEFTLQEALDLVSAITEAQDELCIDLDDRTKYPEASAYHARLEALIKRIKEYAINH